MGTQEPQQEPQRRADMVAVVLVSMVAGFMLIWTAYLLGWWPRLVWLGWAAVATLPLWLWLLWRDWKRAK